MIRPLHTGACCAVLMIAFVARGFASPPPSSPVESSIGIESVVSSALPAGIRPSDLAAAPVRLRIGDVQVTPAADDYDIHYEIREPGVYDLRRFLQSADGTQLDALSPIWVKGVSHLAPGDSGALDVVPPTPLPAYGGYTRVRRVVIAAWAGVFLVLLLWRRFKKTEVVLEPVQVRPVPSGQERLAAFLETAQSRSLTVAETVDVELLLMSQWRDRLNLKDLPADHAIRALRGDRRAGPLLQKVDGWLHVPPVRRKAIDLMALCWPQEAEVENGRDSNFDSNVDGAAG